MGQCEQLGEEIFGRGEADGQGSGKNGDTWGKGSDACGGGRRRNLDFPAAGVLFFAVALEVLAHALVAALLPLDGAGCGDFLQAVDESFAFDEEAFAGGVGAEGGEDADGLAGAEVEEGLEGTAVDGREGKGAKFGDGLGKVLNPLRVAGHEGL